VISQNKTSSYARATIDFTGASAGTVNAGNGVTVTATDSASINATITLSATSETVNESPFSNSDSIGMAGAVSVNDVRGGATATIDNSEVTATDGNVSVTASETATLKAVTMVEAASSGGSKFGSGTSLATAGVIATNVVQGGADANITDSTVTTDNSGDVVVTATDTATIDSEVVNSVTSGDTAIGLTLAFNSIGWESQNVLFNTVDTLIGAPAIADAFGADKGFNSEAKLEDVTVSAAGSVSVTADAKAELNAEISNAAESSASA